jgi:tetratricopeptide (TPR) repeat protein
MDVRFKGSATDRLVNDSLDAGDVDRVRGIVRSSGTMQLRSATLRRLVGARLVTADQTKAEQSRLLELREIADHLPENPTPAEVLSALDPMSLCLDDEPELWSYRAAALHDLGRHEEALEDLEMSTRLAPGGSEEALLKAEILYALRRFHEVISVLTQHAHELASDPWACSLLARSSARPGDVDRAIAVCEVALASRKDPPLRDNLRSLLALRKLHPLCLFYWQVSVGAFGEAREVWNERIRGITPTYQVVVHLTVYINEKNLPFLRGLIRESKLDGELLPLVVAMDYLETGDRSPLEKLSSELRPIANEIVAELQKKLPAPPERKMHKAHA